MHSPASFKVVYPSQIVAEVPIGATTGKVTVTTPGRLLVSSQVFHVTPQGSLLLSEAAITTPAPKSIESFQ